MVTALIDGDVLLHMAMWGNTTYTKAKDAIDRFIEEFTINAFCDDYAIAVGPRSSGNFRDDLYPKYKQTAMRVKGRSDRPEHFESVKNYLYSLPETAEADYEEADDLVSIWVRQFRDAKKDYVIVTVDKDLDQLLGPHYNPRRREFYVTTEESTTRAFLRQLVVGDPMDKIPGVKGFGPVSGDALVEEYKDKSISELSSTVVEIYNSKYGDEAANQVLANGKLLYLKRASSDYFSQKHLTHLVAGGYIDGVFNSPRGD